VRAAGELLRRHADEPVSIAALADELGISLRSLQLSFREVFGLSPRELLGRIRLETARERLLAADPSEQVTTIALDCGFTHLSRFAGAYHQAFGERPSETLRRRRT
jgi:transcriptional regulator GlxA family with amidase domain